MRIPDNIVCLPISALNPDPRNARTHSSEQIKQIAASIKQFGFTNPILIDENRQILAGHGRVEGAKLLDMTEVPVVRIEHMSESEKRAYVIADNQLALKAGWDDEILATEFQALGELEFDLELTGFDMGEIDVLVGKLELVDPEEEDAIPEPLAGPPVTHLGCPAPLLCATDFRFLY